MGIFLEAGPRATVPILLLTLCFWLSPAFLCHPTRHISQIHKHPLRYSRVSHRKNSKFRYSEGTSSWCLYLPYITCEILLRWAEKTQAAVFSFVPALAALATVVAGTSLPRDDACASSEIQCGPSTSSDKRDFTQHPSRALTGLTNAELLRRGLPINNPLRRGTSLWF